MHTKLVAIQYVMIIDMTTILYITSKLPPSCIETFTAEKIKVIVSYFIKKFLLKIRE